MAFRRLSFLLIAGMAGSQGTNAQFGSQQMFFCDGPRCVDLADFDADGALDLLISSRQGLGIHQNMGGVGEFSIPTYIGSEETVACAADVNGDGLPDVIASRENNNGIFLFLNSGSFTFDAPSTITPVLSADELSCADLDQDGDLDLFFVLPSGQLAVSYNADGYGMFTTPMVIATLTQLAYARATDIDADGDLDIVFSSRVMNEVRVCLNDDSYFGDAQQVSVSGHGTAGDLDSDGHADILTANTTAGTIGWQRNDPEELAFSSPEILDPSFNSPEHVTTSDLDGDGDQDAIITSSALQEVAWYENIDGQGSFGPHQTVADNVPISDLVTGDIDNDGDADLFVACAELDKVYLYSNLSSASGMIIGRVFNDINGDGVFNGNDHGLVNMRVEASDLGATYTNASGMYWYNAVPAGYGVSKPAEPNWEFTTPDAYNVTVPEQGVSQNNDFGLQAGDPVSETSLDLGSAPMRCGMDISYWAAVSNTGNQVSDLQLELDLDDLSGYVYADPAPNTVQNGVITWLFANVQPTQQRTIQIVVHLPGSEHVGEELVDVLQATALIDGVPASVTSTEYRPILLCAVDPNDKQVVPAGIGAEHLTTIGSRLHYAVRFQNTGNAPALNVTIVDTLEADLDHATLHIEGMSHPCHALLQTDGVLNFTFENINLPDSGSDFTGSQGYVHFTIDHVDGLAEGTVLNNTAAIYFDNNAPVITNTTWNTLTEENVTAVEEESMPAEPAISILPNPAQGTATVRLSDDFSGRVDVQLYNAAGSLMRQLSRRSNTVVIERGALPEGIYVVRAIDEKGTERSARMAFE